MEQEASKPKEDWSWISNESFRLMRMKAQAVRRHDIQEVGHIGTALWQSIQQDRQERIQKVSEIIEKCL